MNPAAAKLLMCVCAGGTGAAIVPAVHHVRHAMARPAIHRVSSPMAIAAAAPCDTLPVAALTPVAGLPSAEAPGLSSGLADLSPVAYGAGDASGGYPGGGLFGGGGGGGGGGDFEGGGGGGGIGGGGGGGGGAVIVPISEPLPVSRVPEVQSWSMMIAGFGLAGGAMRYGRRAAAI